MVNGALNSIRACKQRLNFFIGNILESARLFIGLANIKLSIDPSIEMTLSQFLFTMPKDDIIKDLVMWHKSTNMLNALKVCKHMI